MDARIRLCGRLEVELGGERIEGKLPGRQGPLVFALMAMNRDRPVSRDELIGALWPTDLPADPDEALSAVLSKVRQVIGRETLTGRRDLTLVLLDGAEVDVESAHEALEQAQAAIAREDWAVAHAAASAAVEIAGRGFLVGHDSPWVEDRRVEIEELRLRSLEALAQAGVGLGGAHLAGAERAARELVSAAPLREAGHRLLMEALAARGEIAEALGAYEQLRVLLRDELGMTPSAAVRSVHERLLAGDTDRPGAAEVAVVPLPARLSLRERGELVGRERELERLREEWAAARAGARRLVVLSGGPGIGKTRLSSELAREAHAEGTVLYAGCQEDSLISYQPFVEALRHYVQAVPLDGALDRLGPGVAELGRLIPELSGDAGDEKAAEEDPETRRYLMFEAVSGLLSEACGHAPMLLVLDDLHWADRSTLQLLRHVARAQQEIPLLILGTYREGDVPPDHPLVELLADLRRDRLFERVSLEGLNRDGVGALMEEHAGQAAPTELVQTVHSETAGNPFFVEEVVRHLIESGVDLASATDTSGVGVPEGVKEVLTLRLGRLSDGCREVLSHAAVLGREFEFDVLARMSDGGEEPVIGALEEALGARLVVEQRGAGDAHAFTHALVQETLYGALSGPRRQRLHAIAAGAIESAGAADPEARIGALAVHYRLAGPAVDPAMSIEYSLRAGERARQLFDWDEARSHWDGAVAIMERTGADPGQRGRLLIALAELCGAVADLGGEIAYLERAQQLYDELGEERRAAQVRGRLGIAHTLVDSITAEYLDIRRAFEHFEAAREVLGREPGTKSLGHVKSGIGAAHTYAVNVEAGREAAAEAMEIAERLGDDLLWAAAAETYAMHALAAGRLEEGFRSTERGFEVADRHKSPVIAWMGLNIRGQWTWGLAAPDETNEFFERPLALPYLARTHPQEIADGLGRCHISRGELEPARRHLAVSRSAWITHSLQACVGLWTGDWDGVAKLAQATLETSLRTGNRWDEWGSHHLAGRVLHLRGELEPAAQSLELARAIPAEGGAVYYELWVVADLARVMAESGQREAARRYADRGLEIVGNGEDWRGRAGLAALADAVVLSFEERPDDAVARFAEASETLGRYRLRCDESECLREWGLALARAGDPAGAAEKFEAAAELYRSHAAGQAWLQRLERDARITA